MYIIWYDFWHSFLAAMRRYPLGKTIEGRETAGGADDD
jgi:hypothetical protein